MSNCKHLVTSHASRKLDSGHWLTYEQCKQCWIWLSRGPASDTPAVLIEVRGAELAAEWKPLGGVNGVSTDEERRGWSAVNEPQTEAWHAGWLGYHILSGHDYEQRDALDVAIDVTLRLLDHRTS